MMSRAIDVGVLRKEWISDASATGRNEVNSERLLLG